MQELSGYKVSYYQYLIGCLGILREGELVELMGDRTHDLLTASQALSQAELQPLRWDRAGEVGASGQPAGREMPTRCGPTLWAEEGVT